MRRVARRKSRADAGRTRPRRKRAPPGVEGRFGERTRIDPKGAYRSCRHAIGRTCPAEFPLLPWKAAGAPHPASSDSSRFRGGIPFTASSPKRTAAGRSASSAARSVESSPPRRSPGALRDPRRAGWSYRSRNRWMRPVPCAHKAMRRTACPPEKRGWHPAALRIACVSGQTTPARAASPVHGRERRPGIPAENRRNAATRERLPR
jgi:hypothetical protein